MTHPDFIEVYDDALDADTCARVIHRFESSGKATRGEVGSGVDVTLKNSWDIRITDHAEWGDVVSRFNHVVMTGFKRYLRKFAHAALGPLSLKLPDPVTGEFKLVDAERVASLDDQTLTAMFTFSSDIGPVPVEINRLDNQALVRYYEGEWKRFE